MSIMNDLNTNQKTSLMWQVAVTSILWAGTFVASKSESFGHPGSRAMRIAWAHGSVGPRVSSAKNASISTIMPKMVLIIPKSVAPLCSNTLKTVPPLGNHVHERLSSKDYLAMKK